MNNPARYIDPNGHRADDGCITLGCSLSQFQKDHDAQKLELLESKSRNHKCAEGNDAYCSTATEHPIEVITFTATMLIGGPALEKLFLGSGAAGTVDAVLWRAGVSCLQSAVCRTVFGMAGGAGAGQGFTSFRALKEYLGDPGENMEWHHIVEQSQIGRSGFSVGQIQNTNNVIAIDANVHAQISGFYSSNVAGRGTGTVRDWLAGQDFQAQYEFGLQVLRRFGIIP
jgi:hypothetical protein